MVKFDHNSRMLNWTNLVNESIQLVKWTGVKSVVLVIFTIFIGLLGMISKGLIINYVLRFAPKNRPINTLMLFEQVSKKYIEIDLRKVCTLYIHEMDTLCFCKLHVIIFPFFN